MIIHWVANRRLIWPLAATLLLALYVVVVSGLPSEVPAFAYDDNLFVNQALSIKKGLWLGSRYDEYTLIKGPFHSIQLAFASLIGLPPSIWLRCLYAFAALSFSCLALPAAPVWIRTFTLTCLLFDPWLISTNGGLRLLREATYIPFEIIALTAALFSFDLLKIIKNSQCLDWKIWLSTGTAGFSLGLLLITREARIIVFIIAGLILVLLVLVAIRRSCQPRRVWLSIMTLSLCFVVLLSAPLYAVRLANYQNYSLSISNEFEDGAFESFYQDLISVRIPGESYKPWVPITQATLNQLSYLEPNTILAKTIIHLDPGWKEPGCRLRSEVCGEYAGGWFMWAWRSALFQSASPSDPGHFQKLIKKSHQELSAICLNNPKILDCRRSATGYLPWPSRWGENQGAVAAFFAALSQQGQGLLMIDRFRQPFQYAPQANEIEAVKRLGIRLPPRDPSGLKVLNRRIRQLRIVGSLLRWAMIIIVLFCILIRWRLISQILSDPGFWLLGAFFSLQLVVLALIQVSSFKSVHYLTMVSPLLTMLAWRMVVLVKPVVSASNPSLP